MLHTFCFFFFFFNDTATTEIYTLSLHDALPISQDGKADYLRSHSSTIGTDQGCRFRGVPGYGRRDRKSTRLNSSHGYISYAVFCLKKKKNKHMTAISNSKENSTRESNRWQFERL